MIPFRIGSTEDINNAVIFACHQRREQEKITAAKNVAFNYVLITIFHTLSKNLWKYWTGQ